MTNELDTIVLTHDIKTHNLKEGDLGTIVHVYADEKAFEVEFTMGEGKTIAVLTLDISDIRPLTHSEILHVRGFATA